MHNLKGDAQRPTAQADRSAALDLDVWIPRTSNVAQLTIQVGFVGSSWRYTTSGTVPAPWRTSYLITVKGNTPCPPPWHTQASGGVWPTASWHTSVPVPQIT